MNVTIDKNTCTGCGLCIGISPDVFQMEGDKASVIKNPVSEEYYDLCKDAEEQCPVEAIKIDP